MTQEPEHASSHPLARGAHPVGPAQLPAGRGVGPPHASATPQDARAARLHARPDDVLQLRGRLRPAGVRRQGRPLDPQGRGQPGAPRPRGRNCAKGPATINQVDDPERILYPLRRTGKRGEGGGSASPGTRRWTTSPGASGAPSRRTGTTRSCTTSAAPATTASPSASCTRGASTATTPTPTSARRARGWATRSGVASTGPRPTTPTPRSCCSSRSHLEAGHYFNPHAQRIMSAKLGGAKLICPRPPAVQHRLARRRVADPVAGVGGRDPAGRRGVPPARGPLRPGVRGAVGQLAGLPREPAPGPARDFDTFCALLTDDYQRYTLEHAAEEADIPVEDVRRLAEIVAGSEGRLSAHVWRSATAGNGGGWQVSRCPVVPQRPHRLGRHRGGHQPQRLEQVHPARAEHARGPRPLERPHLAARVPARPPRDVDPPPPLPAEGRGRLDIYFTRVYNPVWTNPDGFSWLEALTDEDLVGCHVALTPTWSETAWFADYVLPMGLGTERHDVHSYETHAGRWIGFRQPVRTGRDGEARGHSPGRQGLRRQPRLEPRRGVGGERVLDRPVLADRPGRRARHPPVLRVTDPSRRAHHRRRVLRARLRPQRPGPAGEGGRRGPDPAAVHAPLRRRRGGQGGLPRRRAPVDRCRVRGSDAGRAGCPAQAGRPRRPRHAARRRAGAVGVVHDDGSRTQGWLTPSRKLEIYSTSCATGAGRSTPRRATSSPTSPAARSTWPRASVSSSRRSGCRR